MKLFVLFCVGLVPTAFLACPCLGVNPASHNEQPQTAPLLQRKATYQVDFRIAVTPPSKTKVLKVWLPLPQSESLAESLSGESGGDVQVISHRKIETFPRSIQPTIDTEPKFGNQFAYFEFHDPSGAQLITHQFQATIGETRWNVDYEQVEERSSWPESMSVYQRTDPRLAQSARADQTVRNVLNASQGKLASTRLLQAMRWIDGNVTYDHSVASLSADPTHAILQGRGHCSDYHGLCNAFAQAVGFPSRVCYGLQMFDKASPSHCKLEVYLPPYGWVLFDLSETQKLTKKLAANKELSEEERASLIQKVRERTHRGFRENTWLKLTAGSHYDLVPAASGPVNVVRTIYAEADGVPIAEPDPSNPNEKKFGWMTMHRVDPKTGEASVEVAKKFSVID